MTEPPLHSRVLDALPPTGAPRRVLGFGLTAFDDDLFALGYPHLALLRPDGDDPVAEAKDLLLHGYPFRQVVFPRHAATALLRAHGGGAPTQLLPDGSAVLTESGLAAIHDMRPLDTDEARALLVVYVRDGKLSTDVFLCIIEALLGTAETLSMATDALEARDYTKFFARPPLSAACLDMLALMVDRLPPSDTAPHALRLRAWAERAALPEPMRTELGLGALLGEPCVARPRVVVRAARDALVRARSLRAKEPWYTLPDPRLVFLGGDAVYEIELALWRKYGAPYSASDAHRLILERFGRIRSPLSVSLAVSMASRSPAKRVAQAWLIRHADFAAPHLAVLAEGDGPLAEAARALM